MLERVYRATDRVCANGVVVAVPGEILTEDDLKRHGISAPAKVRTANVSRPRTADTPKE